MLAATIGGTGGAPAARSEPAWSSRDSLNAVIDRLLREGGRVVTNRGDSETGDAYGRSIVHESACGRRDRVRGAVPARAGAQPQAALDRAGDHRRDRRRAGRVRLGGGRSDDQRAVG